MSRPALLFGVAAMFVSVAGNMLGEADAQPKKDGPPAPYTHYLKYEHLLPDGKADFEVKDVDALITRGGKWDIRAKTRVRPVKGDRLTDADGKKYTILKAEDGGFGKYLVTTDPAPKLPAEPGKGE